TRRLISQVRPVAKRLMHGGGHAVGDAEAAHRDELRFRPGHESFLSRALSQQVFATTDCSSCPYKPSGNAWCTRVAGTCALEFQGEIRVSPIGCTPRPVSALVCLIRTQGRSYTVPRSDQPRGTGIWPQYLFTRSGRGCGG